MVMRIMMMLMERIIKTIIMMIKRIIIKTIISVGFGYCIGMI